MKLGCRETLGGEITRPRAGVRFLGRGSKPPPHQLGESGGVLYAPPVGSGAKPMPKMDVYILSPSGGLFWQLTSSIREL